MATNLGKVTAVLSCVVMLGVAIPLDNFKLLIVHTNDMHSRFNQTSKTSGVCSPKDSANGECYGGFARVSEAVTLARSRSKRTNTPCLFLIAGDIYQGTLAYTVYKWKIVSKLTNMLKPDAMSLGNHEFDDGVDGLVPFINEATFPVVASNLDLSKEKRLDIPNLKKSVVFDLDGVKVAVIGYVTPETKFISQAEDVNFLDEVASINAEVENLKARDPDIKIFIALGHSGFEMDKKIAANVPDIDAVIGGHTNTFLYSGSRPDSEDPEGIYPTYVTQQSGRRVPVVQAYAYTKYLGQLSLGFDSMGEVTNAIGNPLLLDHKVEQDPFILQELNSWGKQIADVSNEEIGRTKVLLDGDPIHCRLQECNLGNFLADSYVDYMVRVYKLNHKKGWTDTPIAFQQGGGIRTSINAFSQDGKVTLGDLMSVLPFINTMVKMPLKGSDLLEALEWSVYDFNESERKGKFLQYSGLKVEYDLSQPNGQRVTKALARCGECRVPIYEPVEKNKTYNVIMPVFIAKGGDGYTVLEKNYKKEQEMDDTDVNMADEYFHRRSPVYTGVDGRIKILNKPSAQSAASQLRSFFLLPFLVPLATVIHML